jgi:hypothetical protein
MDATLTTSAFQGISARAAHVLQGAEAIQAARRTKPAVAKGALMLNAKTILSAMTRKLQRLTYAKTPQTGAEHTAQIL